MNYCSLRDRLCDKCLALLDAQGSVSVWDFCKRCQDKVDQFVAEFDEVTEDDFEE